MNTIKFDWDDKKVASDLKKHAVSFKEAQSVFIAKFYSSFKFTNSSLVILGINSGLVPILCVGMHLHYFECL